jgi:multicomponent Na+:H+ antiporter subunit G
VTAVAVILISAGVAFLAVSAIGLVRFPDFYTRAHAVAKSETLGILLVVAGLLVHHRLGPGSGRLLFVLVFALIANPTAMHALARAADRSGLKPWARSEP